MNTTDSGTGSAHSTSRRKVLQWVGASAATGLAGYAAWKMAAPQDLSGLEIGKAEPLVQNPGPSEPLGPQPVPGLPSRQLFAQHVDEDFQIQTDSHAAMPCRLVEVTAETVMKTQKGTFVAFSVFFSAKPDLLPDGGICKVAHENVPEMEVFLSPVAKPGKTVLLEAAFTVRV